MEVKAQERLSQTIVEVRQALSKTNDLYGVFGFGSFFRSEYYNDIDLLLVSIPYAISPLKVYRESQENLKLMSLKFNIDITFLTYLEHLSKPLLEHDRLVKIWTKDD